MAAAATRPASRGLSTSWPRRDPPPRNLPAQDYGGDARRVLDYVRGTATFSSPGAFRRGLETMEFVASLETDKAWFYVGGPRGTRASVRPFRAAFPVSPPPSRRRDATAQVVTSRDDLSSLPGAPALWSEVAYSVHTTWSTGDGKVKGWSPLAEHDAACDAFRSRWLASGPAARRKMVLELPGGQTIRCAESDGRLSMWCSVPGGDTVAVARDAGPNETRVNASRWFVPLDAETRARRAASKPSRRRRGVPPGPLFKHVTSKRAREASADTHSPRTRQWCLRLSAVNLTFDMPSVAGAGRGDAAGCHVDCPRAVL